MRDFLLRPVYCRGCCFEGTCDGRLSCDNYSPTDELDSLDIDSLIDSNRLDFFKDWYQYIEEYTD